MKPEIAEVTDYLRTRGIRLTPKRMKVIDEVFQTHEHFDADEMYHRLARKSRSVSRATVYRTLDLLVEGGFVRRNRFQENFDRYEHVLGHRPHAHLVCLKCQKITEFVDPNLDDILKEHAKLEGFDVTFHIVQVFGACPDCA